MNRRDLFARAFVALSAIARGSAGSKDDFASVGIAKDELTVLQDVYTAGAISINEMRWLHLRDRRKQGGEA